MNESTKDMNSTQPENSTPEATGGQSVEQMFTQEEVNRIVQNRLVRARAQTEQSLNARETRLDCREYLNEKKLPAGLLDVLDTTDTEKFKKNAEEIVKMFSNSQTGVSFHNGDGSTFIPKGGTFDWTASVGNTKPVTDKSLASAFEPPKI